MDKDLSCIVLAGGKGERFNALDGKFHKGLLPFAGKTMLEHVIRSVSLVPREMELIISIKSDSPFRDQIETIARNSGARIVNDDDELSLHGVLKGIISCLNEINRRYCFVMPCDMPFFKHAYLVTITRGLEQSQVSVPAHREHLEPLAIGVNRESFSPGSHLLALTERRRPSDMVRGATSVTFVPVPEVIPGEAFFNVNSKDDYQKALKIVEKRIETNDKRITDLKTVSVFSEKSLILLKDLKSLLIEKKVEMTQFNELLEKMSVAGMNFWHAITCELIAGKYPSVASEYKQRAVTAFKSEIHFWKRLKISSLALHALKDLEKTKMNGFKKRED